MSISWFWKEVKIFNPYSITFVNADKLRNTDKKINSQWYTCILQQM